MAVKKKIRKYPRKLTEKERMLICGCNHYCNHGQQWAYCQCPPGARFSKANQELLEYKKSMKS